MPWGVAAAAVAAAGTAYSADQQKKGAAGAARASQSAADQSVAEQRAAREQYQANVQPFLDLSGTALGRLQQLQSGDTSGFVTDPGYQFALEQGLEAIRNRGAAGGNLAGGGTTADLLRFSQGLAGQQYGDYFNRQYNLATLGQNAAAGAGSAGIQTAGNIGNLLTANAQNQGNAYINSANAQSNAVGQLAQLAGTYSANYPYGRTTGTNTPNYDPYSTSQGGAYNFGNNLGNFTSGGIYD